MLKDSIFHFLKDLVDKVQVDNKHDNHVETADTRVFDDLRTTIDHTEKEVDERQQHAGMYDILRQKVAENKVSNKRNTEIPTADSSVYDNLLKEIEALKKKIETKENTAPSSTVVETTNSKKSNERSQMAMTNSMGGSLSIRLKPDFGSPKNTIRLPENSLIQVTEYSDHTINLNGQEVRWAHIDFEGQRGWIPESYLNFN